MKAAVFEKTGSLTVCDVPLRPLNDDEMLIRVDACGICGTDVHIVAGESRSTPPVVLGHEFAGTVVDAGRHADIFAPGTNVAIDPNIPCGTCVYCRRGYVHLCERLRALGVDINGGMSEYCIIPYRQAYALPPGLSIEHAAMIEPISCVVHGIDKAHIEAGESVVILGGGTIGMIMMQLARASGASTIILSEPNSEKRNNAASFGADYTVDPSSADLASVVQDLTQIGADCVIECAGRRETAEQALALSRKGGRVVLFGVCPIGETIAMEPNRIYSHELTIAGSYVNPFTFSRAADLIASGRIRMDAFRIDTFSLDDVHEALAAQREGRTMKSMILPHRHNR
ncbi:MAG TPA: zinc-dependent alcohol dehydrogenase family protein [Bacteroidota bacterium]|nr:zinc-dependent alcohol dehydrogenase family protein [Bacteroidota bacterium]